MVQKVGGVEAKHRLHCSGLRAGHKVEQLSKGGRELRGEGMIIVKHA
jgi:hypothetical protein